MLLLNIKKNLLFFVCEFKLIISFQRLIIQKEKFLSILNLNDRTKYELIVPQYDVIKLLNTSLILSKSFLIKDLTNNIFCDGKMFLKIMLILATK